MGKLAQGNTILKLFPNENIIQSFCIDENTDKDLILITNKGTFVKHNTKNIRTSKKGELGTLGIKFKDTQKIKNRIIDSFLNNKYVYFKTNQGRYDKIETTMIDLEPYEKEKKLKIILNDKEYIESIFSMIIPENN